MPVWDEYPHDYRQEETTAILTAVRAGECVSLVGLSGAGKSNLMRFLAHNTGCNPPMFLVDCNRLGEFTPHGFFQFIRGALNSHMGAADEYQALEQDIESILTTPPGSLCLLLDRFDAAANILPGTLSNNLRALRDRFKYNLTYITATRHPLESSSELAELFFANTFWLGPLSENCSRWSIAQFIRRKRVAWDEDTVQKIITLSWGYPSFLRAVCEATAAGCPLTIDDLRTHPAVHKRLTEFWADHPTAEDIRRTGLEDHPLLSSSMPRFWDTSELTAKEALLLEYFQSHPTQVCEKDDLIRGVWPEDKVFNEGIRDDSLAQLIRRLRRKIEPDPSNPHYIHNVTGRGYRYTP